MAVVQSAHRHAPQDDLAGNRSATGPDDDQRRTMLVGGADQCMRHRVGVPTAAAIDADTGEAGVADGFRRRRIGVVVDRHRDEVVLTVRGVGYKAGPP